MPKKNLFKYFKTSHEIIRLAVMYYVSYFVVNGEAFNRIGAGTWTRSS